MDEPFKTCRYCNYPIARAVADWTHAEGREWIGPYCKTCPNCGDTTPEHYWHGEICPKCGYDLNRAMFQGGRYRPDAHMTHHAKP
jgi:hypothetical protein